MSNLKKFLLKKTIKVSDITINNLNIILTRKNIKNINLRIKEDGSIKVSAPLNISIDKITHFIEKKQDWIKFHKNKIESQFKRSNQMEECLYLGNYYKIFFCENPKLQYISFKKNQFFCFIRPNASQQTKQILLKNWYRKQLEIILPNLIRRWEPILGVNVNEWRIKIMKTRWGSCNTIKKRIWINLSLIEKPLQCLEYVVVHEMVHLLEPSHNKRFHSLMSYFLPEWRNSKRLLNDCWH